MRASSEREMPRSRGHDEAFPGRRDEALSRYALPDSEVFGATYRLSATRDLKEEIISVRHAHDKRARMPSKGYMNAPRAKKQMTIHMLAVFILFFQGKDVLR